MHWSLWVLLGFIAWILLGIAVAPPLAKRLSRKADEQYRPVHPGDD
jgi:hypothetical protein